jgi:ribosome biogenesis protein Tsr3
VVIGDVVMGDECSIWFNAVLRGDVNPIRIGNRVNIQDNSTLHTTYQKSVVEIEDDVTIGHNVVVHGARIEQGALIGIGSVLLDPFSDKAFSPMDRGIIRTRGLVAVDCSWRDAERIFNTIRTHRRTEERALPMLLAANPTKFGRWGELSTLEALAASYYIIGEKHMAEDMLSIYTWGIRFLETNKEPLEAYSRCRDSSEVVEVQKEFV